VEWGNGKGGWFGLNGGFGEAEGKGDVVDRKRKGKMGEVRYRLLSLRRGCCGGGRRSGMLWR